MHLVDGVNTGLTWPSIELRHGRDPDGRDVLVLVGAEPDVRWRAFSADVATRWRSSSQCFCSSVAPGIIIEVNTRRNAESSRP